ncbi:unnamed protein product [Zymoseptoria tritici ST99CH_1E4]|uniref:YMC020W-like alpha/beta hydrolase domain-containing protein n=2 Tax=Zymoseptoria tritici TaxID=1047171 RepID=F9X411_ZYMTI|nr:uncharacterized protein MYCGRDRAFT_91172 [Zymoseptoria tritici IPO323]EGP90145.1 hypothetical protein MYCGRDRAFT_91172 [Zymoseptoria tritici IPO323]SMR46694.1 unnamed protein product [Zymoseptoria tritici ST99CH_1E4]
MAPVRKKSKLDDDSAHDNNKPEAGPAQATKDMDMKDAPASDSTAKTPSSRPGSWYTTSPWRSISKAAPVLAQVARESISVAQGVSSSSSEARQSGEGKELGEDAATTRRRPSSNVSKSFKGSSRKSDPLLAEATRVNATSSVPSVPKGKKSLGEKTGMKSRESVAVVKEGKDGKVDVEPAPMPPDVVMEDVDLKDVDAEQDTDKSTSRVTSGTWFGWWSRPDSSDAMATTKSANKAKLDDAENEASTTPLPGSPEEQAQPSFGTDTTGSSQTTKGEDLSGKLKPEMSVNAASDRSWFGLWSSKQNEQAVVEEQARRKSVAEVQQEPDVAVSADAGRTADESQQDGAAKEEQKVKVDDRPTSKEAEQPKSSGWAFWSKEPSASVAQKQVGELAVADTPSQSHPEAAQFNQEPQQAKTEEPTRLGRSSSLLRLKRGRNTSKDLSGETTAATTPTTSESKTPVETPEASPAPTSRAKKAVQIQPNLVLPLFRDTYASAPNPGYIDRLTNYIGQTLHLSDPTRPAHQPCISPTPVKVRKAIAIGVHGFFPAAFLHRFVGPPTGTSIRFANYATAAIKQWCETHQPEIKDVEVEKVALEGEGYIAGRVETLWKLLLNWLSHLRQADFILIACHSQGVPVAIMLVAKLLQLGCLSTNVRVGICAMAGINLGPFPEYKSRFLAGSASELFDFCDSTSTVSVAYADALEICLRHSVRITFCGSLDDQLVSLESALHTPLSHPYVSRIVFIDGRLHTSNFLTHLVVFATKLRNLGVSDHGLLRELSSPLAGSIVGGEGHSRVYDDAQVYMQAVEFALESTDVVAPLPNKPTPIMTTTTKDDLAADQKRKSLDDRRAQQAAYPKNMRAANHMRRGSLTFLSNPSPGIAPVIAAYGTTTAIGPGGPSEAAKNPFVLPFAVRGMLEERLVKEDEKLQKEVRELIGEFESWRPVSKVLKDVRWRLEGVRSML